MADTDSVDDFFNNLPSQAAMPTPAASNSSTDSVDDFFNNLPSSTSTTTQNAPQLGLADSANKTGLQNNASYSLALYQKTGDPSFLAEAQKYADMGAAISGISQPAPHSLRLASDLGANLESGIIGATKTPNQILSYATDPSSEDSVWSNGTPNNIVEDAINSGSTRAMQQMSDLQNQINAQKSDFSKSAAQNQPVISRSTNSNDILPFNFNMPSISHASTMVGNIAPQLGLFELGGEAAPFAESLGANAAEQGLARTAGYGAANTAISAPQSYEDTYNQSLADNIKAGMTPADADKLARVHADKIMAEVAPLDFAVGAAGGKFAPEVTGNVVSRAIKGAAVGSVPMASQMAGTYALQQSELGKPIDPYELASQAATGVMMAAPMEGGIAVREGKRYSANNPRPEPTILTPEGNVATEKTFNPATGRIEDVGGNPPDDNNGGSGIPIAPTPDIQGRIEPTFERTSLSPITDTDSAQATLDAIKSGDTQNIHPDVVSDLAKNGALQQNDAGQLAVTDLGNRLLDELHQLNSHTETPENVIPAAPEVKTPQSVSPELPKAANANAEDQMLSFKNEAAPEVTPAISDFAAKRLADLEREHDALSPESPLRQQIVDEMHDIVQKAPAVEQATKEGLLKSGDDNTVGAAQEATPQEEQALAEYQQSRASTKGMVNDVPFSVTKKTDSPEFRKWFGDSKVVDEKGEPLTVYHGTGTNIDEFKYEFTGKGNDQHGSGFYFTTDPEEAHGYKQAELNSQPKIGGIDNPNVVEAHLSIKKPLDADKEGNITPKQVREIIKRSPNLDEHLANWGEVDYEGKDKVLNNAVESYVVKNGNILKGLHSLANDFFPENIQEFNKAVQDILGYDGIKKSFEGKDHYVAFFPEQIKSINNRGIYDPNDPRILYKTTPTDKFAANQDNIKTQLNNIIKRINPDVKTEFADKLFGEGEAIKASGGDSTERQEVAGSYNSAENLIKASLNTDKWDVKDTAYHEAYHSVRDMVNATDDKILKKAFPGTDRLAQSEHEAVEFGRYMTEKNASGFAPAVKRIFSAIRQALRDIGRTLKLGGFNSVEDIFNRIERGSVFEDYQKALKAGDIDTLKQSNLTPEQQQRAIKEVSPALHDVVYKATADKDAEALNSISLEAHGTPEEKVSSLGNDVYGRLSDAVNKGLDTVEAAKEKMLHGALDVMKPIISEKTFNNAKREVNVSIAKTKRENGGLNIKQTAVNGAHILIASKDGYLRAIASRNGSKTVEYIADIFHPDPGRDKSLPRGYHEEQAYFVNKTLSRVANLLHEVHEQSDKDEIRNYMTHPESMVGDAVKSGNGRIAVHLASEIQNMRDYLALHGYEVPQIDGFYPRIYDNNHIINNETAFRRDAAAAYMDTYKDTFEGNYDRLQKIYNRDLNDQRNYEKAINENTGHAFESPTGVSTNEELNTLRQTRLDQVKEHYLDNDGNIVPYQEFIDRTIQRKVDGWYNNILLQDDGITADANGYFKNVSTIPDAPSSFKQRVLSKAADDILERYMVKDPLTAMTKLTLQTARKAAWEKFFGGSKLQDLHRAMQKEGVNGKDIQQVMNNIRANTGQLGGDIDGNIKNALDLAKYWTAARMLTKAPFKHLSIAINVGNHTGNPANAFRALVDSTHSLFKTNRGEANRIYAELSGLSGENAHHAMLLNQSGLSSNNEKLNFMTNKYYDSIGMTHLVGSAKSGMVRGLQYGLADMAKDVLDRKNGFKSAEFMMKNYGVPADEVKGFSQWIKDNGGRNIDRPSTLDGSKYAEMYQLAQQRAVDQTISNPTPATRQMYAAHPVMSVVYHMTAYHMTAMKNSLQRNARLFAEGVNPSSNLDLKDRMRFATPLVMYLTTMTLFSAGYIKAKNVLYPPDKPDTDSWLAEGLVNADLGGQFNNLIKDIVGSKTMQNKFGYKYYDFDERKSLGEKFLNYAGPDVSSAVDYIKMIAHIGDNFANSQKKRDAQLKQEYNLLVAPLATSFMSTHLPFALPKFIAIQAVNHPTIRRFLTGAPNK